MTKTAEEYLERIADALEQLVEQGRISKDAKAIMEVLKVEDDGLRVVQEVNVPEKLPKGTKKIEMGKEYKIAGKPCRECGGFISWDDYTDTNTLPVHINKEGKIVGDGMCPNYGG